MTFASAHRSGEFYQCIVTAMHPGTRIHSKPESVMHRKLLNVRHRTDCAYAVDQSRNSFMLLPCNARVIKDRPYTGRGMCRQSSSVHIRRYHMTLEKINNPWKLFKARLTTRSARLTDVPPRVNVHNASRRDLLRGVLIACGGLLAPAAFFGCELQTGSKVANTNTNARPEPFTRARYRAAVRTASHQDNVRYQAKPNGAQQCASCQYFVAASNTCRRVDGQVNSTGWCVLWARKA